MSLAYKLDNTGIDFRFKIVFIVIFKIYFQYKLYSIIPLPAAIQNSPKVLGPNIGNFLPQIIQLASTLSLNRKETNLPNYLISP